MSLHQKLVNQRNKALGLFSKAIEDLKILNKKINHEVNLNNKRIETLNAEQASLSNKNYAMKNLIAANNESMDKIRSVL